jgi:hypothetical protein
MLGLPAAKASRRGCRIDSEQPLSPVRAHLWKEWREQRALLGWAVLALAALALGGGLCAPSRLVPNDIAVWFVIAALGIGFVGLAGDLVPGEARRAQLGLLVRTPGALRASFIAKLAVLGLGIAVLVVAGTALGMLCRWLADLGERMPRTDSLGHAPAVIPWIVGGVAVTAPWAFAVSCWLSRGASVLPATALTLAAVVGPPLLVGLAHSGPVGAAELATGVVLLFAGGVLAAWLSFVRGLRFGKHRGAALGGALAALVFVVPGWLWSGHAAWRWHHVDPNGRDVAIGTALLGGDGGVAFVGLNRQWPSRDGPAYMLAVDLATGHWRQLGDAQAWPYGIGMLARCEFLTGLAAPQPWVVRWQLDSRGQHAVRAGLLDGATGEVVAECPERRIPTEWGDRLADAARRTTPFRLPDGGRPGSKAERSSSSPAPANARRSAAATPVGAGRDRLTRRCGVGQLRAPSTPRPIPGRTSRCPRLRPGPTGRRPLGSAFGRARARPRGAGCDLRAGAGPVGGSGRRPGW